MKRFWDQATAQPAEGGFAILLDGKPMRMPGGGVLCVPHAPLATAIADEWQLAGGAKGGEMSFSDTPLTRLAGTAQHRITPDPEPTADAIARYGETDLLCYRAEAPSDLVRRQSEGWQPWLDWAALRFDAPLRVTTGITFVRQHTDSIAALRRTVLAMDPYVLAGLGIAVPAMGSLILGLAMTELELDAATAHELAALDELFTEEKWGPDDEAVTRRRNVAQDIDLAYRFIRLSRGVD